MRGFFCLAKPGREPPPFHYGGQEFMQRKNDEVSPVFIFDFNWRNFKFAKKRE